MSPVPRRTEVRGQTLVLFALTILLISLMVMMTLGFGMRVKEKHELQTLADSAAYSNAVMTARTYNNISLLNRSAISLFVIQASNQALISYTSMVRAYSGSARMVAEQISLNGPVCARARADALRDEIEANVDAYIGDYDAWRSLDTAAGHETEAIQGVIADMTGRARDGAEALGNALGGQTLTEEILDLARPGTPWNELRAGAGAAGAISRREALCSGAMPGPGGICMVPGWTAHTLSAAYGTRGSAFIVDAAPIPPAMAAIFTGFANASVNILQAPTGGGHWAADDREVSEPISTNFAWGHHHGEVEVNINLPGCDVSESRTALSYVRTSEQEDVGGEDRHHWTGQGEDSDAEAKDRHDTGRCSPFCPSVWVRTMAFYPGEGGAADAFGQPKSVVVLNRDYSARGGADPWSLVFNFRFNPGTAGERFDNRGLRLSSGEDISEQSAHATAMTYYHRHGQWREHPNLLNPFWRATLVSADVDAQGKLPAGTDVPDALGGGLDWQQDALRQLVTVGGYRGMH